MCDFIVKDVVFVYNCFIVSLKVNKVYFFFIDRVEEMGLY